MCLEPASPRLLAGPVLTAAAAESAYYARYVEDNAITCAAGTVDLNVYISATGRPTDRGLSVRSDLLGGHLKGSVFVYGPSQLGYVLPSIPGDEAH